MILLAGCGGCGGGELFWRDQYVFIGDDGTVLPLAVLRWSSGHAEVKAWLGQDGRWQNALHRRFAIADRDAADLERTLRVFGVQDGPAARVTVEHEHGQLRATLRTPSRLITLRSDDFSVLGEGVDPEGPSTYMAGRAVLRSGDTLERGFLLSESTPTDQPKRAFVDYGDYALVFAASRDRGAFVMKRSLEHAEYDRGFAVNGGAPQRSAAPRCDLTSDALRVRMPELAVDSTLRILDRASSRGVAPGGQAVQYETLLLGGDYAGVAFLIHPDNI